MRRKKKILLSVLAVIVLLAALFIWRQRGNLQAGWLTLRYSGEQLQDQVQANEEKSDQIMNSALPAGESMGRLDDEERQAVQDGTLDPDEAVKRVLERSGMTSEEAEKAMAVQPAAAPQTAQPDETASDPAEKSAKKDQDSQAQAEAQARIKVLVAQVYVMRDSFVSQLDSIRDSALAEYKALPASEHTNQTKMEFASRCIDQASALEASCDSQVDSILSELTQLLKKTGGDASLVSQIREVYANEKALKKADYLNTYLK